MESEQIVRIRLDLEGEDAKRFLKLKEKRGLKNNSELVRLVLKEAADREDIPYNSEEAGS
ncbi:MAG: hypothetical protein DRJ18_00135 [Candidatus Methanomethylicota archaeon]|nr:MAG: hypothetical protein DRJ18_00135 [Candidatus Verstraetearchaeota archaeon]